MTTEQKIEIIKAYYLFNNIPPEQVELLAKQATEKTFSPKARIITQTEPASAIYLIYKGLVKIYLLNKEGNVIPVRIKEPPYIVGELNVFDNESTINIEAIQETHTLIFPQKIWKQLIIEYPGFAYTLLGIISEKLHVANKQTDHYVSERLKDRIWGLLQKLGSHFPDKTITASHEEISFMVGATRARVTEILNELAKEKLIKVSHRKIILV